MAIYKTLRTKPKPNRSPILFLVLSILAIAFLCILSSSISINGSLFRSEKTQLNSLKSRHSVGHEKYLYWGYKIDCPGKHCDSCEGLGHQESSLRCALEEALFLQRTLVMPSRMCINPIHNKKGILHHSSNATSEEMWAANSCAMDSLYDLDLMSNTVPVILDNSKMWYRVLSTSMKLGARGVAHVAGVSRIALRDNSHYSNLLLINRTASPLSWELFGKVLLDDKKNILSKTPKEGIVNELERTSRLGTFLFPGMFDGELAGKEEVFVVVITFRFMECKDRNNRSAIMLPYSFLPSMAAKKLRDAAGKIKVLLGDYDAMHVRRGDKIKTRKDRFGVDRTLHPHLDRDTRPEFILRRIEKWVPPGRTLFIASNERTPGFFSPLSARYRLAYSSNYSKILDPLVENNYQLFMIERLILMGAKTYIRTFKEDETYLSLTDDPKKNTKAWQIPVYTSDGEGS